MTVLPTQQSDDFKIDKYRIFINRTPDGKWRPVIFLAGLTDPVWTGIPWSFREHAVHAALTAVTHGKTADQERR